MPEYLFTDMKFYGKSAQAEAFVKPENVQAKLNEAFFSELEKGALNQEAIDAVNSFTSMKMKEDGFFKKILPPIPISDDALDQSIPLDEIGSITKADMQEAAISIPFSTLPLNTYIKGPAFKVQLHAPLTTPLALDEQVISADDGVAVITEAVVEPKRSFWDEFPKSKRRSLCTV